MQDGINVLRSVNQFPADPVTAHKVFNCIDVAVEHGVKLRSRGTVRFLDNPHVPRRVFGKGIRTGGRKIDGLYFNPVFMFF